MMNAHANKGFAPRLGYALGSVVRFFLYDERPVLRWVKRAGLFLVLAVLLVQNFTWLASTFMTLLCFGLLGVALVKGDTSLLSQVSLGNIANRNDEDEGRIPFRGEYEHPDYHLYYEKSDEY